MTDTSDSSGMDDVFRALSDPSRRYLLDSLNRNNGHTLRQLCAGLAMARQSVSKHVAVLEAAHLVTTQRRGREKLHFLNAAPINAIADRWINRYDRPRAEALAHLRTSPDEMPMTPDHNWSGDALHLDEMRGGQPSEETAAAGNPAFTGSHAGTGVARFGISVRQAVRNILRAGPSS